MKDWNYAKLSHMAKETGGPEKLVEVLVNSGKLKMVPWLGVAFAGGIVFTKGAEYLAKKKQEHDDKVEAAKQELIQGIKDYEENAPVETMNLDAE